MSSVNKKEIEKFSKIASEWWNPEGKFKPLHKFNPIRIKYIKENIIETFKLKNSSKPLLGINILDIGCGGGLLSEALHDAGAVVYGIDASKKTIEIAKNHAKERDLNITYINESFNDFIESNDQKFDHVVCFEMIEHVDDQNQLIHHIGPLLNKKSKVFFSTINRNLISFIFAKVVAEYVLKIVPKNTHTYDKFVRPSELNKMLQKNNFKTENITGLKFNPLSQTFSLSEFNKINYFLTASKK